MICVPNGMSLMPLNFGPIFHVILSIPSSMFLGASSMSKIPEVLNL